ncbi:MAG: Rieske (2Fe-2S) protein [Ignavibacteria bacterium]|nr:Rieske (2Fe-2S) protein [Ignavibacteria bacterium]
MTAQDKEISRRNFLSQALTGWISISVLPVLYGMVEYALPSKIRDRILESMHVAKEADLLVGSAKIVKFNKQAIALLKSEQGQVRALSAVCTHLGCIVQYQSDRKVFHCNCHGSEFDLEGRNISGPAPRPLQPFKVDIKEGDIIISRI